MRNTFKIPKFKLAIFVLALTGLGVLVASHAQTPLPTPAQQTPATNPADAQKAARAKLDEKYRAIELKKMEMGEEILSAWHNTPVDVYMVGSDLKQPSLANVTILSTVELPNGVVFYSGRDSEKRGIILNPSQIVMTRTVGAIWKEKTP